MTHVRHRMLYIGLTFRIMPARPIARLRRGLSVVRSGPADLISLSSSRFRRFQTNTYGRGGNSRAGGVISAPGCAASMSSSRTPRQGVWEGQDTLRPPSKTCPPLGIRKSTCHFVPLPGGFLRPETRPEVIRRRWSYAPKIERQVKRMDAIMSHYLQHRDCGFGSLFRSCQEVLSESV
jgi:hypothetical protein